MTDNQSTNSNSNSEDDHEEYEHETGNQNNQIPLLLDTTDPLGECQSGFLVHDTRLADAAGLSDEREAGEISESEEEDDDITKTKQANSAKKPKPIRRTSNRAKSRTPKNYKDMASGKKENKQEPIKRPQAISEDTGKNIEDNGERTLEIAELEETIRQLTKEKNEITLNLNEEKTMKLQAERKLVLEIDNTKRLRKTHQNQDLRITHAERKSESIGEANKQLHKTIQQLETQLADHLIISTKEAENNKQASQKQKHEIEKLKKETQTLTRELASQKKQAKEKEESSQNAAKKLEKTTKEQASQIKSLEELNSDLLQEITEKMEKKHTKATPKIKYHATLLADSNGPNILQNLMKNEDTEWRTPGKLYTAENITDYAKTNKKELEKVDAIAILCGTNHIKKNEEAIIIKEKLTTIIKNLPKQTPKILIHVPSFKTDRKANLSVEVINYMMQDIADNTTNTHIAKYRDTSFKALKTADTMHDELHLNRQGVANDLIADCIQRTTLKAIKNKTTVTKDSQPPPQKRPRNQSPIGNRNKERNNETIEINIPYQKVGLVIGRSRANLIRWTETDHVETEILRADKETDDSKILLKGGRTNTEKVANNIKALIRSAPLEQPPKLHIPCRFELKGGCKRKDICPYQHQPENRKTSKSPHSRRDASARRTSRSPLRSPHSYRDQARSRRASRSPLRRREQQEH